ncbi:MAG: hypothetical protein CL678_01490 [Bdellovibrionaceae bacterium]|nr:hypothetical protein [Pseudobdellovibrionaceae bacterium]
MSFTEVFHVGSGASNQSEHSATDSDNSVEKLESKCFIKHERSDEDVDFDQKKGNPPLGARYYYALTRM